MRAVAATLARSRRTDLACARGLCRVGYTVQTRHASKFAELERSMWEKSATAYSNSFALVTAQATDALLDGAAVPRTVGAAATAVYTGARDAPLSRPSRRRALAIGLALTRVPHFARAVQ